MMRLLALWILLHVCGDMSVTTVGAVDITIQWAVPVQPYAPRTVSAPVYRQAA
jgi:hypothetical protein